MSDYIYDLPISGELYDILTNTIAPNLTFTQCNLYECLSQIFMYLDGYPVLTKDNVLDIRYFNDNNEKANELSPSDTKKVLSEDKYVNGFITDFQNAELNNVITYPSKKAYSSIQSSSIGIVSDEKDYIMRVDNPIYKLRSVKIYVNSFCFYEYVGITTKRKNVLHITYNSYIDIIDNVLPYDLYLNLETSGAAYISTLDLYRENCLYWQQKTNEIKVGATYKNFITTDYVMPNVILSSINKSFGTNVDKEEDYMPDPNFKNVKEQLKYQIEYETLTKGRLLIEGNANKYEGAERLDIGSSASDIMKLGLNLLGTSVKTGINTLVRTEKFSKYDNRIKVGSLYYENGDRYIATQVDEAIIGDYVLSTIQYTKNFNKLSQFISIDQKKRFNEVDNSLTLRSEDVYKEYLYFSLDQPSSDLISDIHFKSDFIKSAIKETFKLNPTNETRIDFAGCETINLDGTSNATYGEVLLPIVQYGSGNALCFEMSYSSAINANSNFKYDTSINAWYSKYILYTANDGFADVFNIIFYNQTKQTETSDLPQITINMTSSCNKIGGFTNLHYYKKPNEIFALNYELLCLSYNNQDIFIGERFIKYNGLISNSVSKQKLKLFISSEKLYSMFDKQGLGSEVSGTFTIATYTPVLNDKKLILGVQIMKGDKIYQLDKNIKSWALCDEENNIYISANQEKSINDYLEFFIFTSHNRV